jgi:hypothetical protein
MIRLLTLLGFLLAACAAPLPPSPEPVPAPPAAEVPPEPVPPPAKNPEPARRAVKDYRAAERAEEHAITKPAATPESITAIRLANRLARKAAADLVAQDGRPTAETIDRARRTLDDLIRTLQGPDGEPPSPQGEKP